MDKLLPEGIYLVRYAHEIFTCEGIAPLTLPSLGIKKREKDRIFMGYLELGKIIRSSLRRLSHDKNHSKNE